MRLCARSNLADLPGLHDGTLIKLERSGVLQVVEAPPAVYTTNFAACLQQAFLNIPHDSIPESITLRVSH